MTPSRKRPPYAADERTQLVGWLDMQRAIIHWKCEGLSDEDAHRAVLPASPLMTMAGLVSHLRWTEQTWFEVILLGRPDDGPQFQPGDAEMRVEGVPIARLLEEYDAQCRESNRLIAEHSLDAVGKHPGYDVSAANLRWIILHMIEETARHAGHADAIREILDGGTGYY
jgi:uncharacterized damage-inducible protein DinB